MTKPKFTKGPWRWRGDYSIGMGDRAHADIEFWPDLAIHNPEEWAANMRLYAASELMYEALEQCLAELQSIHSKYGDLENAEAHSAGIRVAKAALKQARGEE